MHIIKRWVQRWLGITDLQRRVDTLEREVELLTTPHPNEIPETVRRLRWEKRRDTTMRAIDQFRAQL